MTNPTPTALVSAALIYTRSRQRDVGTARQGGVEHPDAGVVAEAVADRRLLVGSSISYRRRHRSGALELLICDPNLPRKGSVMSVVLAGRELLTVRAIARAAAQELGVSVDAVLHADAPASTPAVAGRALAARRVAMAAAVRRGVDAPTIAAVFDAGDDEVRRAPRSVSTDPVGAHAVLRLAAAGSQSAQALQVANEIRVARAQLKRQIARGERSVGDVLSTCPPEARSMQLGALLGAQPQWGQQRVARWLGEVRIELPIRAERQLGALTAHQRAALLAALPPAAHQVARAA